MTIEKLTIGELLNLSGGELASIPQNELEKYFEKFLNVTRPERASVNPRKQKIAKVDGQTRDPSGYAKAKQYMMDTMGINLDEL